MMNAPAFDTADLRQLASELADAGLRSVSFDATEVKPPGAWLRLDDVDSRALDGTAALGVTVFVVAPANGYMRSLDKLAQLLELAVPVLHELCYAVGKASTTGLVLPGSSAPLPSLSIPVTLHTAPTPTTED